MKYAGLILIIICSFLIGVHIKTVYTGRVALLEKCIAMLNLISINLNFTGIDTVGLINSLGDNTDLNELSFLENCKAMLADGNDFSLSWNKSVNHFNSYLKKEDKDILLSFGSMLGKSDLEGQIRNCHINIEKLKDNLKKAKELSEKYADLYFRLSLLCGALISLILY
jgi:stage III sporulation protein AB